MTSKAALNLSEAELAFLRQLLGPHLEYYRTLAGSSHCTGENRKRWEAVRALSEKLEAIQSFYDK